jgi:ESCRT-II complex subunit VPS36
MVRIAEQIGSRVSSSSESKESAEFRTYLVELGIADPVTKESAGSAFHAQLSGQLSGFLLPILTRPGALGMLSLVDAYTLFNRARGVALVSPEDLKKAAELFSSTGSPLRLKTFPKSGLTVIAAPDASDSAIAERMWSLCASQVNGVTAIGAAGVMGVSVSLAGEWLLVSERVGLVCRDETVEGLRFYENRICGVGGGG